MSDLFALLSPTEIALSACVALMAGTIKGMVGFAMPMIMISGLGTFLTPELALAGLVLPTVVSNVMQAMRHGVRAAVASVSRFRVFLLVGAVFLVLSAQLFRVLPVSVLLLMIGLPIVFFATIQLLGVRFELDEPSTRIEAGIGAVAGFIGGMSGVWGPPTVAYLTALNTPKADQLRVQGVIYGLGAIGLLSAHVGSGVVRAETVPFSALMVIPAVIGMWVGGRLHDRINQETFRKVTLAVLVVAGLNLVLRGLSSI